MGQHRTIGSPLYPPFLRGEAEGGGIAQLRKNTCVSSGKWYYFAIVVLWPKYGNVSFEGAAVAVTGFILIWYAWETYRLRVEAQKQTELSLRPCVIARVC